MGFALKAEIVERPATDTIHTEAAIATAEPRVVKVDRGEGEVFTSYVRLGLQVAGFYSFADAERQAVLFEVLRECSTVDEARSLRDRLNAHSVALW
ncbi:hypothetical protein [Kaistia sp. MMO-174]|uniref:hypothetical protein n=1 Tax=Kaistia sp. MMO-174 TaxID=3081256 RepID=UPI00301A3D55